jgi:hypothetical protein
MVFSLQQIIVDTNHGVTLEEHSMVYFDKGNIFIPIIVRLPSIIDYWSQYPHCVFSNLTHTTMIELVQHEMELLIPEQEFNQFIGPATPTRQKRIISTILGLTNTLGMIWNRISLHSIESELKFLRNYVHENKEIIDNIKETACDC